MDQIAALFDMDHTITWKNAGLSSVQFAHKQGMVPLGFLLLGILKIGLYRMSLLNIDQWYERNMDLLAGLSLSDMDKFSKAWFEAMIRKAIYQEAHTLIRDHQSKGHRRHLHLRGRWSKGFHRRESGENAGRARRDGAHDCRVFHGRRTRAHSISCAILRLRHGRILPRQRTPCGLHLR